VPQSKAKTLADFRAAHDKNVIIPNKIRAAFVAMLKESLEQWDYEADFMRRAGISTTDLATFRDQFMDHIVIAPSGSGGKAAKRVWFADVKVAKKVRGS